MAMFNFTRKNPTEGYSSEDKEKYNSLVSKRKKARSSFIGAGLAMALSGLFSYESFTSMKNEPTEYARLKSAQMYFDGVVSAIDNESRNLESMTNIVEVADYKNLFMNQNFSAQREFARKAHYSLQRKIEEFGFDESAHKASNGTNIFFGGLFAYLAYRFGKKLGPKDDEISDTVKQIKDLKEKYEKIEAEEAEKRRQNELAEEHRQMDGGH